MCVFLLCIHIFIAMRYYKQFLETNFSSRYVIMLMEKNLLSPDLEKNSIITVSTFKENNKGKSKQKDVVKASKQSLKQGPQNGSSNKKRKKL